MSAVLNLPGKLTAVSWEPPADMGVEQWLAVMEGLKTAERSVLWVIGDGLRFGEKKYGETYAQAMDATDSAYQTLANAKWVAEKIAFSRRREKVPWSYHAEVAALDAVEADKLLSLAEAEQWTRDDLRRAVRRSKTPTVAAIVPEGKFRVIYADPPWRYNDKLVEGYGPAEHHYETLSIDDLCAWPVREKAEDDSALFLWVTSPLLFESKAVIDAWGFEYKSSFVWDKVKHNMGHYNSVRHELLLVCTRGSCTPEVPKLVDSVVEVERGAHSVKPARFREIIDTLYPSGRRVEVFARECPSPWVPWGDQVSP